MATLYVFGPAEQTDYLPARDYTCLCAITASDSEKLSSDVARHASLGRETHLHAGRIVGRDSYPVLPSVELAAALVRAGWTASYCPTREERDEAIVAGVPVK